MTRGAGHLELRFRTASGICRLYDIHSHLHPEYQVGYHENYEYKSKSKSISAKKIICIIKYFITVYFKGITRATYTMLRLATVSVREPEYPRSVLIYAGWGKL